MEAKAIAKGVGIAPRKARLVIDLIRGKSVIEADNILNNLNKEEYHELLNYCDKAIESYYKYYNSVFGILESINKDYKDLNLDATEIQKALNDPENMGLLRDILAKLG